MRRLSLLLVVIGVRATSAQPVANPQVGPSGQPGPPASIELEIVDGTAQDLVHVMRPPGAKMVVRAVIRDAAGNILQGPVAGCTPIFQSAGSLGVQQGTATFTHGEDHASVSFDKVGVFSVSAHCEEAPNISSEGGNHAPFNFEATNSSFAPGGAGKTVEQRVAAMHEAMNRPVKQPPPPAPADEPPPSSGSKSGGKKGGAGGLLVGAVLGYFLYRELSGGGSDACTDTYYWSYSCQANCQGLMGGRLGPYSSYDECQMQLNDHLFAWGKLGASVSVTSGCACESPRNAPSLGDIDVPTRSSFTGSARPQTLTQRFLAGGRAVLASKWVRAGAVATLGAIVFVRAYRWLQRKDDSVLVTPYVDSTGAGVTVLGRF